MYPTWLVLVYLIVLLLVRLILFLACKYYLAFGKQSYNSINKSYKPKSIIDRFFFGYIKNSAKYNKSTVKLLYGFNIINTVVTLLTVASIILGIYERIYRVVTLVVALIYSVEFIYLRIMVTQRK